MPYSNSELMMLGVYILMKKKQSESKSQRKKKWMKYWLQNRDSLSHINLINELRLTEPNDFRNYLRMDENTYTELLELVSPYITKKDTVMRSAISAHERLSATLRYLATGRTYEDMKYSCIFSKQSLSKIIPETCRAIYTVLMNDYMKFPSKVEDWYSVAEGFEDKWQFPHCLGCLDGKHVAIIPPFGSGSYYFNYKGFNSIILLAMANSNYEIMFFDVGTNGRISDGGVLTNTSFYDKLINEELQIPEARRCKNSAKILPYVFLGDDAFSLRPDFLKPFSYNEVRIDYKIFNLRLCRARRIIENVFGILVRRFQVFEKPINLKLKSIELVVAACCILHNYLRVKSSNYIPNDLKIWENPNTEILVKNDGINNNVPNVLCNLQVIPDESSSLSAKAVREMFMKYFLEEGQVPWQWNKIEL